ncbi:hypothetical protein [Parabacteroides pacaensis]|uniref:hypothetical protein n=1 Tax=Parabacteroides pacaensis TaxID=2086575 RepID=UPI000D11254C|nr:hypothetical protein [Parabacteroides pacaensis]
MKTNKIIDIFFLFFIFTVFTGCDKEEDMFAKFPPEILYKRLEMGTGGESWQVSPDVKEITLESGITEWTVRARVSAPNGLNSIELLKVNSNNEKVLATYAEFTNNPNVYELNFVVSGVVSETVIRIKALDTIGNQTAKDFKIKVQ